jgi:hypothetical protein
LASARPLVTADGAETLSTNVRSSSGKRSHTAFGVRVEGERSYKGQKRTVQEKSVNGCVNAFGNPDADSVQDHGGLLPDIGPYSNSDVGFSVR